jgi:hypothetical protein
MLAPRPIAVTYFGSKSTHQPLKCAQFRLGAIVARQVMGHGQKVWFDIFLIRLRGGEICPYNCISFILKSDFFDLITSVQAIRRSRPHSHCGSIRFRTFLLLYSWRGHDFTKIQPQPGCLITKPIADVFNNHKTNIYFFIKTGLFLYIANFFLNNYSVLFNCSDVQKTPPKKKLKNKKSLLAFFDHLDTPQSHTC